MTTAATQEEREIRQIRQGDTAAMRAVYERYIGHLTAVCTRYVPDEEDAKDVLQESFVKIFSSFDRFQYRGEGSLKAWLTRVVVNEAVTLLRERERMEVVRPEWDLPDVADEEPPVEEVPAEVIHRLVASLPPGYRMVFNLYVFEHKSHKEIARLLHIRENSSASQLHRAKELLAKGIMDYKAKNYG